MYSTPSFVMDNVVIVVSLVTLGIFWYLWTSKQKTEVSGAPLPPGPRGIPIMGYLPFLDANLPTQFSQMADTYGPIFKLWLGSKLCIVISSPALVKQVVRDQDALFANRDPPKVALSLTYGGIDVTWSPFGPYWRLLRKVFVREIMSNSSLDACYTLRKDVVVNTIKYVGTKIGTPIDIGEIMFITELNVITSLVWGDCTISMNEDVKLEFRQVISKITELLGKPNVSDLFPMIASFDIQGVEKEMKKEFIWFNNFLDEIIEKRIKGADNEEKKDLLQVLLKYNENEDPSTHITTTQIKALLMDIIVGGIDTTTSMAEWVMAEMLHNPDVMKRAQEEIAQVVGLNDIVEESHLPKLPYLDAIIKETFRLYPAVPLLVPRCPSQTCIVGGYSVPKGTRVFLNVYGIQRDPKIWDNPNEFRAERFLNDSNKWDFSGNNFEYLPFGSGRRICPGIPLAERMLKYVIASLIHTYDWQLPLGVELDLSMIMGLVMKKRKPLVAIPSLKKN